MLNDLTELRIVEELKETIFDKYANAVFDGKLKKLIIREDLIMLEKSIEILKQKREEYALEIERIKQTDLEAIKNARFEEIKESIVEQVINELNDKIAEAEQKVKSIDFSIALLKEEENETFEIDIKQGPEATQDEVQ